MKICLFEDEFRSAFLPLVFTRPVWDLRIGIDKIREKWERMDGLEVSAIAASYLAAKFSDAVPASPDTVFVNGCILPYGEDILRLIRQIPEKTFFLDANRIMAFKGHVDLPNGIVSRDLLEAAGFREEPVSASFKIISKITDLYQMNRECIEADIPHFAPGCSSDPRDKHSIIYGADNLHIAAGVKVRAAVINAEDGPVYIGPQADIQEGALIHNAHAILDHAVVNMGAKLRGDSTIGPHSKVGGEVSNSVIQGYSNKGHDGFLGNSVLGYWCNLGADTNTSNLKNNYASVKIWDYASGRFKDTGTIFCGLIMGDHSKCGINTMFNTGTVVGVNANIFGSGYPRNFIPSFTWGGPGGVSIYQLKNAFEVAEVVMKRRNMELDEAERKILEAVFEETRKFRNE